MHDAVDSPGAPFSWAAGRSGANTAPHEGRNRWTSRLPRPRHLAWVGIVIIVGVLTIAVFADVLAPHDPYALGLQAVLQPPSAAHPFGTDEVGRDVLSRVIHGSRLSLRAAVLVLIAAASIGIPLGVVGGYFGGLVDDLIMRSADIFLAFPSLILAIAIAAALGAGLESAILAVGIVWWPDYARLVRSVVLSVKSQTFIEAARTTGASDSRIMFRHILPSATPPLLVKATLDAGYAILFTASLSFVGAGAQEPLPEWGKMIATGRDYMINNWWYATFPGLAVFVAVLGLMWVGDYVQDATDPRRRA
jgi:peptide/nickel transport system permease protein